MPLREKEKKRRPKGRSGSSEEVAGAYFTSKRPVKQLPAGPPKTRPLLLAEGLPTPSDREFLPLSADGCLAVSGSLYFSLQRNPKISPGAGPRHNLPGKLIRGPSHKSRSLGQSPN